MAGGLVVSQLLTLYITPVIYTYLDRLAGDLNPFRRRKAPAPLPSPAE